mmetsp:Transcript_32065/g.85886  ORF Transcript_32065/g.85886 Transcript_32065/m.85886 type:complete len:158 (+) Transcript_32065:1351-1824(+)
MTSQHTTNRDLDLLSEPRRYREMQQPAFAANGVKIPPVQWLPSRVVGALQMSSAQSHGPSWVRFLVMLDQDEQSLAQVSPLSLYAKLLPQDRRLQPLWDLETFHLRPRIERRRTGSQSHCHHAHRSAAQTSPWKLIEGLQVPFHAEDQRHQSAPLLG